ncbi:MAG: MFS transporter [Hyphomicrobiaceae bacterium]
MTRRLWIMLICGVLVVLIGNGLRLSFGIFLRPVSLELGIGRETFGLVIALQALLYGAFQPIAGMLADRYGAVRVITIGALIYAIGLWLTSVAASAFDLYISLGLLVGLGLSCATNVIVLGAIGKVVPNERRGIVFGTVIASGSLGMFFFVPGAQHLVDLSGWRWTLVAMAILMVVVPLFALGLRAPPADARSGFQQSVREAAREAMRHRSYLLLTTGFFVCGFHVTFIGTHFPAYLSDNQVSPAAASYAFGVIGLFNILGAYLFGALGDRYSKKSVLTLIYLLRAALMTAMLLTPLTDFSAILFGACMGLIWLSTVPLTSGIVAQVFGPAHFSFLFGIVFMSHQLGGFTGAWLGGRIYDATGSYDLMWIVSIALGLISAAFHWPISDRPLARLQNA